MPLPQTLRGPVLSVLRTAEAGAAENDGSPQRLVAAWMLTPRGQAGGV